jgi:hypothetical protein
MPVNEGEERAETDEREERDELTQASYIKQAYSTFTNTHRASILLFAAPLKERRVRPRGHDQPCVANATNQRKPRADGMSISLGHEGFHGQKIEGPNGD